MAMKVKKKESNTYWRLSVIPFTSKWFYHVGISDQEILRDFANWTRNSY